MSTALVGEGPIGGEGRGSWIVSARNSYRSWPARPLTQNDVGFAFADAHAKLVYDATPTQQFDVTVLGGRSTPDTVDEPLVSPLGDGLDRAALERVFAASLGIRRVVWLGRGIVGDDTHGHIDDLARFVGSGRVLLCREDDPKDAKK